MADTYVNVGAEITSSQSTALAALAALPAGAIPVKASDGTFVASVYTDSGAAVPTEVAAGAGWTVADTFVPTSGGDSYALSVVDLTINQTGSANGPVTAHRVNITETACKGADYLCDYQINGTSKWSIRGTAPIQSAAGATWDGYKAAGLTQLVLGNTRIQTAGGFNKISFYAPTLTSDTPNLIIDKAATLKVYGPPIAGTNVAITTAAVVDFGVTSTAGLYVAKQAANDSPEISAYGIDGSLYFSPTSAYAVFFSKSGNSVLQIQNSGSTNYSRIRFYGSGNNHIITNTGDLTVTPAGNTVFSSGNVGVGTSAFGANAAKTLALTNSATAPIGSADICHLYSADHNGVAGAAALAIYQEAALVASGDKAATHEFLATINGTPVWILCRNAA